MSDGLDCSNALPSHQLRYKCIINQVNEAVLQIIYIDVDIVGTSASKLRYITNL